MMNRYNVLTSLVSTNYLHLCREALWLLANNESLTVQEEFDLTVFVC